MKHTAGKLGQVTKAAGGKWKPVGYPNYRNADWTGYDHKTPYGSLRVAREGDDGEEINVYAFDPNECQLWRTSFSHATPDAAIVAFIRQGLGEAKPTGKAQALLSMLDELSGSGRISFEDEATGEGDESERFNALVEAVRKGE